MIDLDAFRAQEHARGICPAEQLTDHDRHILETDIPWFCSLAAGHEGDHEVWVTYTFTDGQPSYRACCHTWSPDAT